MTIFNIQRFSTHDGEGIRTLVFFKGCTLKCAWCSNPEGVSFGYDLMYDSRLCKHFEDCIHMDEQVIRPVQRGIRSNRVTIRRTQQGIHIDRKAFTEPERFRDVCPSRALTVVGEVKSVMDLMCEIEKDRPFYRQEGGVTLSGGEPLAQGPELKALLLECRKRQIFISIETSLHVNWDRIERCLGIGITFLADLKHTDCRKFKDHTGGDSALVTDNLKKLAQLGEHIIIRIPVIPGFNHSENEMKEILDFAASLEVVHEVHFLPYHKLGAEKYTLLGLEYTLTGKPQVKDHELKSYIDYAQAIGLQATAGG